MCEDEARMRSTFDTIAPFVNEIFHALANYDVRFEFDEISFDSCQCEKVSENEYNLFCSLKELPNEDLRVEGKESDGALTLRLSEEYKESFEKACWEDICLPANALGYRFFSTKKLFKVLIDSVKHAIEDVTDTGSSSKSAKCKISECNIVLEVKVYEKCLSFNLLPCIQLDGKTMKMIAVLDEKIKKISKHLKMTSTEYAYLVAKPVLDFEELWRIAVNNIEIKLLNKMTAVTQCGAHCLFAVNFLNEKYFAAGKVTSLLPFSYVRLAILTEFLKFPNGNYWKTTRFVERVESVLQSLETQLSKGELKNIYTGVNILGRREGELAGLSRDVGLLRSQFRKFLLNFT